MSALQQFLQDCSRLFIITGAGCSAPSGIRTYRADSGEWQAPQPVQHQDFVRSEVARRRYWARSMRGWPHFAAAQPNAAHRALAALEAQGRVVSLVTQNVDGLHQRAGQTRLIELHGTLSQVVCIECGHQVARARVQTWLETHNPALLALPPQPGPDGDADLGGAEDAADIQIPQCPNCSGILKPDVVFYGDCVPRPRVADAFAALQQADGLLVIGSSLMVYSSFRFARTAFELGMPMAAVNLGVTRADDWYRHQGRLCKLDADCAMVLPSLFAGI